MNCPVDSTTLVMSERKGVEIDYCPQCRGVWLDRGELDKIIDQSDAAEAPPRRERDRDDDDDRRREYRPRDDDRRPGYGDPRKKKKKSFLGDLFEFGE